jgi:hypothetical protein
MSCINILSVVMTLPRCCGWRVPISRRIITFSFALGSLRSDVVLSKFEFAWIDLVSTRKDSKRLVVLEVFRAIYIYIRINIYDLRPVKGSVYDSFRRHWWNFESPVGAWRSSKHLEAFLK